MGHIEQMSLVSQQTAEPLGDGVIDNYIIDPSVHLTLGVLVLISMTAAVALTLRHAVRNEAISGWAQVAMAISAAILAAQVLLGIKLLDQGQGIVQLYIHYVGGLIPMAVFAVSGWFARGDSGRSARVLAALLVLGYVSALMAFFIGRSYANGG